MSEKIVMTPKGKTSNSTTLIIERKAAEVSDPDADNVHVAGGDHKGIVINKTTVNGIDEIEAVPEISLQFRVFLVNGQTGSHTQESRKLLFWFKPSVPVHERPTVAQEFFKELVTPQHFPRDYVGFIKMLMKLMQNRYPTVRKLEVELKQLAITKLPERPVSSDESIMDNQLLLTAEKVLEIIEAAYPHPITVEELAKQYSWDQDLIRAQIEKLKDKKVVKAMDHGAYTRVIQHDKDVQIVKHMPTIIRSKQPTIAIITAQYCEKLAVDAMMENRETFVRYTTVGVNTENNYPGSTSSLVRATRFGESNVYTLGNMGGHRVVCTKLPTIGYTREAMTSAGNTTTRLLGTFSKVDFVFLVGVGGGVPHYTDYTKHVRLGDVIVSSAAGPNTAAYTYCEHVKDAGDNEYVFEYKSHNPQVPSIQQVAASLLEQYNGTGDCPWYEYMAEGRAVLEGQNEHDFGRPSSETDKLYMSIGEKDVIEVNHPVAPDETDSSRLEGCPRLHLGPIACGQGVSRDARLREAFSRTSRALAFDFESDSVVESIVGNCRESWALVRGIADYKDGQRKGPWQPFASLAAAAVTKSIICGMEPPPE